MTKDIIITFNISFFDTAFNVGEAFTLSAQAILNNIEKTGIDTYENRNKITIDNIKEKKKEGCC